MGDHNLYDLPKKIVWQATCFSYFESCIILMHTYGLECISGPEVLGKMYLTKRIKGGFSFI